MQVLVVDDEPKICELIRYNLERYHYGVITAFDGTSALELACRLRPNLIILDIMLPGIDGLEVCREIRRSPETAAIPIIILTARGQEIDKILGFELGADDYVTKPFSPRELMARVKAQVRRSTTATSQAAFTQEQRKEIHVGDLVINPDRFEVFLGGQEIRLSRKEFSLLLLMASHPGQIFTRDQLMSVIWGYDSVDETRTVDVHIRYLRRKIERDPSHPKYIETIRGLGYRFKNG
ncbi:MAG: DNA-binding response regulator [Desulforudis sp.]|jgi:two-component system alkaline phosphatase synthesis response regulator PhoP|nr:MAG: DNA-binding response regulator [Desulforudis sp.]